MMLFTCIFGIPSGGKGGLIPVGEANGAQGWTCPREGVTLWRSFAEITQKKYWESLLCWAKVAAAECVNERIANIFSRLFGRKGCVCERECVHVKWKEKRLIFLEGCKSHQTEVGVYWKVSNIVDNLPPPHKFIPDKPARASWTMSSWRSSEASGECFCVLPLLRDSLPYRRDKVQNHKPHGKSLFPLEMNKASIHSQSLALGNVGFISPPTFSEKHPRINL